MVTSPSSLEWCVARKTLYSTADGLHTECKPCGAAPIAWAELDFGRMSCDAMMSPTTVAQAVKSTASCSRGIKHRSPRGHNCFLPV